MAIDAKTCSDNTNPTAANTVDGKAKARKKREESKKKHSHRETKTKQKSQRTKKPDFVVQSPEKTIKAINNEPMSVFKNDDGDQLVRENSEKPLRFELK